MGNGDGRTVKERIIIQLIFNEKNILMELRNIRKNKKTEYTIIQTVLVQ